MYFSFQLFLSPESVKLRLVQMFQITVTYTVVKHRFVLRVLETIKRAKMVKSHRKAFVTENGRFLKQLLPTSPVSRKK